MEMVRDQSLWAPTTYVPPLAAGFPQFTSLTSPEIAGYIPAHARAARQDREVVTDEPAREIAKIGTKLVAHGSYMTFQMAEIVVPRDLFWRILEMIDGPRQKAPARC